MFRAMTSAPRGHGRRERSFGNGADRYGIPQLRQQSVAEHAGRHHCEGVEDPACDRRAAKLGDRVLHEIHRDLPGRGKVSHAVPARRNGLGLHLYRTLICYTRTV